MEILSDGYASYTGEDVKNITEAILLAESVENAKTADVDRQDQEKVMKEWMHGGDGA